MCKIEKFLSKTHGKITDCLYICPNNLKKRDTDLRKEKHYYKFLLTIKNTKAMKYKLLRFSLLSMLVMLFGGWSSQTALAADNSFTITFKESTGTSDDSN